MDTLENNELAQALIAFTNSLKGNDVVLAKGQKNSVNSQEDLFAQKLIEHGFSRRQPDQRTKSIRGLVLNPRVDSYPAGDSDLWFVEQPYGSQSFPDFLVGFRGLIIPIELKSNKGIDPSPFWNGHLPIDIAIYLVTDGKPDATFFLGKDYLPQEDRETLLSIRDKITALFKEIDQDDLAMNFRVRVAWDSNQESPFSPEKRKARENNVLNFLAAIK